MKTAKIKLAADIEVPIKCDLYVLQEIQDEYETVVKFEKQLLGIETVMDKDEEGNDVEKQVLREPKPSAVMFALVSMVREGYAIEGVDMPFKNSRELIASVTRDYRAIAKDIHNEFRNCFQIKK